jgi:hypothetical protein
MDVNDKFADILIPGAVENDTPPSFEPLSDFDALADAVKRRGADKASFREISKLAWDFTCKDNEDVYVPNGSNTFKYLTREQLRCYLYHRENFKKGVFATKYPAYIYLYISEVLIRDNAASELAFILSNTAYKYPNLKSDLCRYIKDCYIVNETADDFTEYIKKIGAESFFPSYLNPPEDNTVTKLYSAGDFDTSKSSFFTAFPDVREALPDIFGAVIGNCEPLFKIYDIDPTTLIRGESGESEFYYPFTGVYYAGSFTRETTAFLSPVERYVRRGSWFMRSVVYTPSYVRKFSTALIRLIETKLREIYDYRYQLAEKHIGENIGQSPSHLGSILSSHFLHDIVSEICINFSVSGSVDIITETCKSLASHMDDEPIRSYREAIKKNSPLAALAISEYTEYLLWNAKIENGIYEESPFINLYIKNLTADEKSLRKLCLILKNIPTKEIIKTLPEKIFLNHSKIKSEQSFEELASEYAITEYFPDIFIRSEKPELRAEAILRIALVKDKFITDETKPLITAVIYAVFDNIRADLKTYFVNPDELFFENGSLERKLFPVVCKFFCKQTFSVLKSAVNYPGKNTPESFDIFKQKFSGNLDLRYRAGMYMAKQTRLWQSSKDYFLSDSFCEMISDTALLIYKESFSHIKYTVTKKAKTVYIEPAPEPIEVTVDFSKLHEVRKTADEITEKLIVAEEIPIVTENKPVFTAISVSDNPYRNFYESLDEISKNVLRFIADGGDYVTFLRDKNILPEVAIESINETALEITGDIIIDNFKIIEDYSDEIKGILL